MKLYEDTDISYKEEETVIYSRNGRVSECSVSQSWIENNFDFNTLLNNLIFIFDFFDLEIRLNLVSKSKEIGVFERIAKTNSKYLYFT